MADGALVYYEIRFESVDDEIWPAGHWYTIRYALKAWLRIWPTEHWYTMRYVLKARTMKDDRLSTGLL